MPRTRGPVVERATDRTALLPMLPADALLPPPETIEAWKWEDPWLVPYLDRLPRILFYALQGIPPHRIAGRLPGLWPVEVRLIERVLELVAADARKRLGDQQQARATPSFEPRP